MSPLEERRLCIYGQVAHERVGGKEFSSSLSLGPRTTKTNYLPNSPVRNRSRGPGPNFCLWEDPPVGTLLRTFGMYRSFFWVYRSFFWMYRSVFSECIDLWLGMYRSFSVLYRSVVSECIDPYVVKSRRRKGQQREKYRAMSTGL